MQRHLKRIFEQMKQTAHGKKRQQGRPAGGQQGRGRGGQGGQDELEQQCNDCAMGCLFPNGLPKEETGYAAQPICMDPEECIANNAWAGCFNRCLGDDHPVAEGLRSCKEDFPDNVMMCMQCGMDCMEDVRCAPDQCGENPEFLACHPECMADHPGDDDEVVEVAAQGGGPDELEQQANDCAMECALPNGASQPICDEDCVANAAWVGCFNQCLGDEHPVAQGLKSCKEDFPDKVMMCLECGMGCMEDVQCAPNQCGENPEFLACHPECMADRPGDDEVVEDAQEGWSSSWKTDGADLMQVKKHLKRIFKK